MPIYEYGCGKCGGTFEEFQSLNAPPVTRCSLCGSKKVRRLVSNTSFILKGSGWYVTDYSKKSADASGDGKGNGKGKKTAKDEKKATADASPESDRSNADKSGSKQSTSAQT